MSTAPTRLVERGRWLIVAILACAAGFVLCELVRAQPVAQAQATSPAQAGHIYALAGQLTSDTYGVYMVDMQRNTLAVYQWLPGTRKLRFLAARNFTWDLQLEEYNTEQSPREIRQLVEQQQRRSAAAAGERAPQ